MRTLALVTDAFGGFGGISKFNRDLLTSLCDLAECDEIVALPRLASEELGTIPGKLTYLLNGIGGKLKYSLATLVAILTKRPFDLVICGHINLLPLAWLCSVITGGRLLLVVHGIDAWKPTGSWLANNLVDRIDFFISVSDFTRQKFCEWSGVEQDKGFILPNCIEVEKFGLRDKNYVLVERYRLGGKKVIMTLGRMSSSERYKGFDEILEVLPELALVIPEIAYLIVGDGDDRARLQQKAVKLGVAERVIFTGRISEEEKADHYRLADVFAMPGRGEGFGIVYLEAMACGVPVIASDCDGSREAVLGGKLGLLVDPASSEQLQENIIKALKKPIGIPEELGYFYVNKFSQRLHAIIGKIMDNRS